VWLSALLAPAFLAFEAYADQFPITDDIDGRWNKIVTETLKNETQRKHVCEENQCTYFTYFKPHDGSTGYLSEVRDKKSKVIERDVCFLRSADLLYCINFDKPQPIATVFVKDPQATDWVPLKSGPVQ
jgi:hypothetical protein